MVQSSRGWDEAPRSGWGVKPSVPPSRKGARPLREAARVPLPARASAPPPRLPGSQPAPRPPSGSHAPPAMRSSPPLPRWLGRDGGWAACAPGGGWAGGCPPAGTRAGGGGARGRGPWCGFPGLRFPAGGPARRGVGKAPAGRSADAGGGLGRAEAEDLQSGRGQSLREQGSPLSSC